MMNNYGMNPQLYNYFNDENNVYSHPFMTVNISDPYDGFIKGNMFPDLYKGYKLSNPIGISPMNEQAELLTYIDALTFAVIDLGLYLDTHPEDKNMLNTFDKFCDQKKEYMKIYQEKYGPILMCDNDSKAGWLWSESPWPWENS